MRAHNDLAIRECNREAMHCRFDVEEDRNIREREIKCPVVPVSALMEWVEAEENCCCARL